MYHLALIDKSFNRDSKSSYLRAKVHNYFISPNTSRKLSPKSTLRVLQGRRPTCLTCPTCPIKVPPPLLPDTGGGGRMDEMPGAEDEAEGSVLTYVT